MSSFCSASSQSCVEGCCDKFGECPSFYGNSCYYYYSSSSKMVSYIIRLGMGQIIGIAVGSVMFVLVIITLICWYRRRQAQLLMSNAGVGIAQSSEINTIIIPNQNMGWSQPISVQLGN
jgi:hypothetical protein